MNISLYQLAGYADEKYLAQCDSIRCTEKTKRKNVPVMLGTAAACLALCFAAYLFINSLPIIYNGDNAIAYGLYFDLENIESAELYYNMDVHAGMDNHNTVTLPTEFLTLFNSHSHELRAVQQNNTNCDIIYYDMLIVIDGKPKIFINSKNSKGFINITSNGKTRAYQFRLTAEEQQAIADLIS